MISDVVSRYAQGIDAADIDAVLSCFSKDARVEYNGGAIVLDGHDEMRKFWQGSLIGPSTHIIANMLIEIDGGDARAMAGAVAFVTRMGGFVTVRGLRYTFGLIRGHGSWMISHLHHACRWESAIPTEQSRPP
jgi:ketosteroid isomerase-like protein